MVPFAGFWSKDEILASAFEFARHGHERIFDNRPIQVIGPNPINYLIFIMALAGAFLTAFYMFRLLSYVFLSGPGKDFRYRATECPSGAHDHSCEVDTLAYSEFKLPPGPFAAEHDSGSHEAAMPREVPMSMWIPLVILAVFSTVYGFIGMPFLGEKNLIARFLQHGAEHLPEMTALTWSLMSLSLVVVIGGILIGLQVNNTEEGVALKKRWKNALPGLYRTIYNKYYIDEFYEEYIIQPVFLIAQVARAFDNYVIDGIVNAVGWLIYMFALLQGWWDNKVVDGLVNACAWVVGYFSDMVKPIQSGYVQNYMMLVVLFVLFYLLTLFVR
jgi:NADH:ubiquinone oxidoreductase subunit 5 (subunit L)/multisubunit Na+/H+ antiporter MnhA subunit